MSSNHRSNESTRVRFGLSQVLYAFALLGASMGLLGVVGLLPAFVILVAWIYIFSHSHRPRALIVVVLYIFSFLLLAGLLLPAMQPARESVTRSSCRHGLRHITLALHEYHAVYKSFPPAFVTDKDGKPMHSWRVLILPFLGRDDIHKKYNFNEPWDGPNNRKLANKMPRVYACRKEHGGHSMQSSYSVVVGPHTAWPGATARSMSDIVDGDSNSLLVVEAKAAGANWMEPRDLSVDEFIKTATAADLETVHREDFFYEYDCGRYVGLVDASVHLSNHEIRPKYWREGLVVDDGKGLERFFSELESTKLHKRVRNENVIRLAIFGLIVVVPLPWVWSIRAKRTAAVDLN